MRSLVSLLAFLLFSVPVFFRQNLLVMRIKKEDALLIYCSPYHNQGNKYFPVFFNFNGGVLIISTL